MYIWIQCTSHHIKLPCNQHKSGQHNSSHLIPPHLIPQRDRIFVPNNDYCTSSHKIHHTKDIKTFEGKFFSLEIGTAYEFTSFVICRLLWLKNSTYSYHQRFCNVLFQRTNSAVLSQSKDHSAQRAVLFQRGLANHWISSTSFLGEETTKRAAFLCFMFLQSFYVVYFPVLFMLSAPVK